MYNWEGLTPVCQEFLQINKIKCCPHSKIDRKLIKKTNTNGQQIYKLIFISEYKFKTMTGGYFSLFNLCSVASPLLLFFFAYFVSTYILFFKTFLFCIEVWLINSAVILLPSFWYKTSLSQIPTVWFWEADDTYNTRLFLLFTNPSPLLGVILVLLLGRTSPSIFVPGWYLTQS